MVLRFAPSFDALPEPPTGYGPQAAERYRAEFIAYHRHLLQLRPVFKGKAQHLRLTHAQEPPHVRRHYPPNRFGAFFHDLDDILPLVRIDGLRDGDDHGYFALHRPGSWKVAGLLCFTEHPDPALTFMLRGTFTALRADLAGLRDPALAQATLARLRALPDGGQTGARH
ncbi:MAG: hypothetical protein OIF47_06515 [Marinibacterium sp.]|nr:hypothetical protein [Marinibacterium sp.]